MGREFESIDPGGQFTWDNSSKPVNRPKNRYANVVAYDHSRVNLHKQEGETDSDYINANFMDGYRRKNMYIATQVSNVNFHNLQLTKLFMYPTLVNACYMRINASFVRLLISN